MRTGQATPPSRWSPAERARTSSSIFPAGRSWSVAWSAPASITPARMRCEGPRPDGDAAPRHRRRHGHRQDRAGDRGRDAAGRGGDYRRDHLGRFAAGLSRPRHRDGEGDARGAARHPASRPRPRRPRRPVHGRRLHIARPGGPRSDPRATRAGDPRRRPRAVPASGRARHRDRRAAVRSRRPRPPRSGVPGCRPRAACRTAAHRRTPSCGRDRYREPRRVVRALEVATVAGGEPEIPAPRGYDGPVAWIGLEVDPATHREWIASRARAQFDAGLIDEATSLRLRYDPALPAFSAIGYREAWAV